MKKKLISYVMISSMLISIFLTACDNKVENTVINDKIIAASKKEETTKDNEFGAKGAKSDTSLTLEKMLTYSMEDEYLAKREYEVIIDKFGEQRPFTNIIKAEESHINQLTALFSKYSIPVPEDKSKKYAVVPENLNESFKAGINAEIENIGMYERFLKEDIPEDVKNIFIALRNASKNHLGAFQRNDR